MSYTLKNKLLQSQIINYVDSFLDLPQTTAELSVGLTLCSSRAQRVRVIKRQLINKDIVMENPPRRWPHRNVGLTRFTLSDYGNEDAVYYYRSWKVQPHQEYQFSCGEFAGHYHRKCPVPVLGRCLNSRSFRYRSHIIHHELCPP